MSKQCVSLRLLPLVFMLLRVEYSRAGTPVDRTYSNVTKTHHLMAQRRSVSSVVSSLSR